MAMDNHVRPLVLHPLIAPLACGVLSHVFCHRFPPASLKAFAAVSFAPAAALTYFADSPSFLYFLRAFALYILSLGISIGAYRLSPFHPLAKYPGPTLAKVSRFWAARQFLKGQQHRLSHELFLKYGDVVRTGPNHLIIRDAKAINTVLGPKDMWPKPGRYEVFRPEGTPSSLLATRDPVEHGKRRRLWDRAFTPAALKSYQPMLENRVGQLLGRFTAQEGQVMDIAKWFGYATMDFMGDFAYGGVFNTVTTGRDDDGFHEFGIAGTRAAELAGFVPWVRTVLIKLPMGGPKKVFRKARTVVDIRMSKGSQYRDLFFYLLNEDGEGSHPPLSRDTLMFESTLAIVAGSDTTGTALANTMFYLITHPEVFARLRREVDAAAGEGTSYDVDVQPDVLGDLKYLQAVINETLRLQPAVPNGVQRTPPQEGGPVIVAGHVVPVGTVVQIPTYSLHRDPRYFLPDPDAFWPERWLHDEGAKIAEARGQPFRLDQAAYMPFNFGPGNCIGRSLALHELRTILSAVVRRFDARFAPGFTAADWTRQLKDSFILERGTLSVVLTKRV